MNILILEDDPERWKVFRRTLSLRNNVEIVDTVEKAKDAVIASGIAFNPFDLIFIDHDLGGEVYVDSENENTGYQFAKWLAENEFDAKYVTHSLNPIGARNICAVLPGCDHVPFHILQKTLEECVIS